MSPTFKAVDENQELDINKLNKHTINDIKSLGNGRMGFKSAEKSKNEILQSSKKNFPKDMRKDLKLDNVSQKSENFHDRGVFRMGGSIEGGTIL